MSHSSVERLRQPLFLRMDRQMSVHRCSRRQYTSLMRYTSMICATCLASILFAITKASATHLGTEVPNICFGTPFPITGKVQGRHSSHSFSLKISDTLLGKDSIRAASTGLFSAGLHMSRKAGASAFSFTRNARPNRLIFGSKLAGAGILTGRIVGTEMKSSYLVFIPQHCI